MTRNEEELKRRLRILQTRAIRDRNEAMQREVDTLEKCYNEVQQALAKIPPSNLRARRC